jgi:hypothetical protein
MSMASTTRIRVLAAWLLTLVLLSTTGCTTWRLEQMDVATQPKPARILQIWVGGEGHKYHNIRVEGDSLHATAFTPTEQYRARPTSFALSEIDSIRTGRFSPIKTALGVVGIAGTLVGIWAASCCNF